MSKHQPRLLAIFSLTACFFSFSQAAMAEWMLDSDASSLFYVTSKAAAISELNSFDELSGSIDDNGRAMVSIGLGSVDTAIEIRDERMREIVFQVGTYPIAAVNLAVDANQLVSLSPGESFQASYDASISLHGMQQIIPLDLLVTGLQDGGLQVTLAKPLLVNAASFGLSEAVEQLREIAGLQSINNNVVVDFTLQFDAGD